MNAELRLRLFGPIRMFVFHDVAAAQQKDAVVVRLPRDIFHLLITEVDLLLDRSSVDVGIRIILSVQHLVLNGLQYVDLALDGPLRRADQRNARLRVSVRLPKRSNSYAHFLRNRVTGGIVARTSDTLARRNFSQLLAECANILVQLPQRHLRSHIVLNDHRHTSHSLQLSKPILSALFRSNSGNPHKLPHVLPHNYISNEPQKFLSPKNNICYFSIISLSTFQIQTKYARRIRYPASVFCLFPLF